MKNTTAIEVLKTRLDGIEVLINWTLRVSGVNLLAIIITILAIVLQ